MRPGRELDIRNQSGFRGVSWHVSASGRGRWRAQAAVRGKVTHLGLYDTPEEAAVAVNDEFAEHAPWRPTPNPSLPTTYVRPAGSAAPTPRPRMKRAPKAKAKVQSNGYVYPEGWPFK